MAGIPEWVDMIDVRRSHIPGDTSWTARLIGDDPEPPRWGGIHRVSVEASGATALEAIRLASGQPLPPIVNGRRQR
jgi:hypothetical protein